MTHTLDLPAELESGLEAKAARLGMPMERYIIGVLRREVEANGNGATRENNPVARALALRDELAASIQAGTRRSDVPLDAAADLAILREERFADV
jgi:hypothetical protein